MENERTDVVCVSCGARLRRPARVPGAVYSGGRYTVRRHGASPVLSYRAKRGFAVMAGVLPTPPVHTASAASPLKATRQTTSARQAAPHDLPVQRELPTSVTPARPPAEPARAKIAEQRQQTQTTNTAPRPERRSQSTTIEPKAQSRPTTQPAASSRIPPAPAPRPVRAPVRPSAQVQRSPRRRDEPTQAPLIGGLVIAGLLLGMGGTWWATVHDIDPMLVFAPPARTVAPALVAQQDVIPPLAAATRPVAPAYHPYQPPARQPEPPVAVNDAMPVQIEPAAPVAAKDPIPAQIEPPVAESIAKVETEVQVPPEPPAQVVRPEKQARAPVTRQAKKRSPPIVRQDRSEEIDRLRTQAFSETRKDRLERINGERSASKLPISSARASRMAVATRHAFSDCDRSANILRREQCRWKVCGGKWGQNGCPSYETRQAALN